MTETVVNQTSEGEKSIDGRRLVDVSVAFSRHFGNYGYETPIHLGSEDSRAELKRKYLDISPAIPSGADDEALLRSASLDKIKKEFPEYADITQGLDSALVRADGAANKNSGVIRDYSFSTVRNAFTRRLLGRLNIALSLDGSESVAVAEQKLEAGGKKIKEAVLGPEHPPTDLNTFSDFDVIVAVYDGRIILPSPVASS